MIDYIRFSVPVTYRDSFLNNPKFVFSDEVDMETGELLRRPIAKFMRMKIEILKREIVIHGSIHKFYNLIAEGSAHNYNQFKHSMLSQAIKWLMNELNINPEDTTIHNLEFGLNIPLDNAPKEFISNNVLMLKYRAPSQVNEFKRKGYFTEYIRDLYYVKVYSKSQQYNLDTSLIRFEIKTRKMKHIEKTGIHLLTDLLDKEKLLLLKGILLKHMSYLVIIDSLDFSAIKDASDREFMQMYTNPQQIKGKIGRDRMKTLSGLIKKLDKYDLLHLKREIMYKIAEAWDQCMKDEPQFENPPKPLNANSELRIKGDGHNSPIYIV